jgi:hypothetical protein
MTGEMNAKSIASWIGYQTIDTTKETSSMRSLNLNNGDQGVEEKVEVAR